MGPSPNAPGCRTSRRGWTVLLLNRLHYTSVVLSSFAFGLFLPFIQADLGLSYLEVGILQGVWWGTSALFLLPFSVLFGRFDPNRRILCALALITPMVFTQGLAIGFWTLLASRFLTVLTHAAMAPTRPLLLRHWAARRQYSTITSVGLSVHSAGMAAVLTFSPLIIVALASWRLAYFLQGALLAVQLAIWAILTAKAQAQRLEPSHQDSPASQPPSTLESTQREPTVPAIHALIAYPQAWLLGGIMLCLAASWTTVLTFMPTLLEEQRGIAISGGSILFGFLYYALIPGGLLGGKVFRFFPNRKLMVLVPAIFNTAFTVAALLSGSPLMAAASLTGLGLVWVFVPAMEVLPFEFRDIEPRQVSVVAALVLTFSAVGFGGGPVVAGAIAQASGSLSTGVLSVAALTSLAIVAAAIFPSNPSA